MKNIYNKLKDPNYSTYIFSKKGGNDRAKDAIIKIFKKVTNGGYDLSKTKCILLHISTGDEEVTIDEIGIINDYIQGEFPSINIVMGIDEKNLSKDLEIRVLFTDLELDSYDIDPHKLFNTYSNNTKSLPIYFLKEDYSSDEISEMISFISDLYKNIGGDGIKIRGLQSKLVQSVLEPIF